jgi:hydrogenase maturation protease
MNAKLVEEVANAVLYEGYLLYPYRSSSVKNQQRWNFGVVHPPAFGETSSMQTECLVQCPIGAVLRVRVRFLHLIGEQAMPREVEMSLPITAACKESQEFAFEPLEEQEPVQGRLAVAIELLTGDLFKVHSQILNTTAFEGSSREEALKRAFISTHTILSMEHGQFISLLDPPAESSEHAAACKNIGTWPVLVGEDGTMDAMLSSPIILYDYPKIAPESPGALFDGTEIDEILTLRIMTLTDQEKMEMASTDDRAKEILERTESMPPEQFMKLHGILRSLA